MPRSSVPWERGCAGRWSEKGALVGEKGNHSRSPHLGARTPSGGEAAREGRRDGQDRRREGRPPGRVIVRAGAGEGEARTRALSNDSLCFTKRETTEE